MEFPTVEDFKKAEDSTKQPITPWSELAVDKVLRFNNIPTTSTRYGQRELGYVYSPSKGAFQVWIPEGVKKQIVNSQARTPIFLLNQGRIPTRSVPSKSYFKIVIMQ